MTETQFTERALEIGKLFSVMADHYETQELLSMLEKLFSSSSHKELVETAAVLAFMLKEQRAKKLSLKEKEARAEL